MRKHDYTFFSVYHEIGQCHYSGNQRVKQKKMADGSGPSFVTYFCSCHYSDIAISIETQRSVYQRFYIILINSSL